MEDDQPHAFPNALRDALDDLIIDIAMGRVTPPDQHIGLFEYLVGQAVLGILQRRGLDG